MKFTRRGQKLARTIEVRLVAVAVGACPLYESQIDLSAVHSRSDMAARNLVSDGLVAADCRRSAKLGWVRNQSITAPNEPFSR